MTENHQQTLDRGKTLVDIFVRRTRDESYRILAEYLALPDLLTPELVSYIHNQFLFSEVKKFEAGADILLSDLCRLTGPEQYSMDTDVREYLLESMEERPGGAARKREVARLLLGYLTWFARKKGALYSQSLENQRLGAMMYIDEERKHAVTELVKRINACLAPTENASNRSPESVKQAEMARICRQIENFARVLSHSEYGRLVDFARDVKSVLDGDLDELTMTGLIDQKYELPEIDVELPSLIKFIPSSIDTLIEQTIFSSQNDPGNSYDLNNELVDRYHSATGLIERCEALIKIAEEFSRLEKYEPAGRFYEFALEMARRSHGIRLDSLHAGILMEMAEISRISGKSQQAIDQFTEALGIYSALEHILGRAKALAGLGLTYHDIGELQKAAEFIESSIRFYQSTDDYLTSAATSKLLAETYLKLEKHEKALEHFEYTLNIFRRLEDLREQGLTYSAIANVLDLMGRKETSLKVYLNAVQVFSEIGDQGSVAAMLERASSIAHDLGRNAEALDFAETALKTFFELDTAEASRIEKKINEWRGFELITFNFSTVTLNESGKVLKKEDRQARQFNDDLDSNVSLEMVEIPGGEFFMGTSDRDAMKVRQEYKKYKLPEDWVDRESPQHKVTLSPFYIGKFQITQQQWRTVAGWPKIKWDIDPEPSHFKGKKDSGARPVEQISWHDAVEFCARLAKKTGRAYRLPTEAEWEYACRAGTDTPFAFGETITPNIVNYDGNYPYAKAPKGLYRKETIPVGNLGVANAFGLFDMHGNVWEWCSDWYEYYPKDPQSDPTGPENGHSKVLRGGSWVGDGKWLSFRLPFQL